MLGLGVMIFGAAGVTVSLVLEIRLKEPIYGLMMKIFPLIFALGCLLYEVS